MRINIWGPLLWELIHTISLSFTLQNKGHYITFFNSIVNIIPCNRCKQHYKEYLKRNSIQNATSSYKNIVEWVNKLHNRINKQNNKKVYTFQETKNKFFNNDNIIINNKGIFTFISYIVTKTPNNDFKIFIKSLFHIYPDIIIRNKLKNHNQHKNIDKIISYMWYKTLNIDSIFNIPKHILQNGSWVKSSKYYYIEDGYLYAYLRQKNNKYNFDSIKLPLPKNVSNIDGFFKH